MEGDPSGDCGDGFHGAPEISLSVVRSTLLSVGLHALVLAPGACAGGFASGPSADVARGLSSVELEFIGSPGPLRQPDRPEAEAKEEISPAREQEKAGKRGVPQEGFWTDDGGAMMRGKPSSLQNPAPRYPWAARIHGWEGTVVIEALVTPAGWAASARLARSSGYSPLDEAALAALGRWRFIPARKQGQAVASQVEIPVTFKLSKEEN